MMLLPLLVVSSSARFFLPQVLPYTQPSPQVQFSQINAQSALRSSPPTMIVNPDLVSAPALLPTTFTIADSSSNLVLIGGVLGLLFVFIVVGTVVINFGIRKK